MGDRRLGLDPLAVKLADDEEFRLASRGKC